MLLTPGARARPRKKGGVTGGTDNAIVRVDAILDQLQDSTAILGDDGSLILTTAVANGFAVGRQGSTAPAFAVDSSAASSATGVKITAAAAGSRVSLAAISSGTDEGIDIDAKGAGTIRLGNTSTGAIVASRVINPNGGIQLTGHPPVSGTFAGNGGSGLFFIDGYNAGAVTANSATANEWVAQFTISSSTGGANQATATKGGLYAHGIANAGSADCYGANIISQASSGLETKIYVTSLEINHNNNNSDRPSTSFEYGSDGTNGQYYGLTIGHGGTHKSSAAIYITDLTGGGNWQRAIALGASAASRAVIEDQSNSTYGWLATGTKTTALDFGGATLTQFAIIPNNAPIQWKDSGGTARSILNLNGSNGVIVGDTVHNVFVAGGSGVSFAPSTDNQVPSGGASNRWASIHFLLGKIYGSSSGVITTQAQAAGGTYNWNWPTTAGSSGDLFTSGGGGATAMSWTTPGALTKTDDTNITLTLGGTPATALVKAASLTLGWTGTLAVTRGGLGFGTTTQGDILYADASNSLAKLAKDTGTSRFLKNSGTSNNPAWAQPATSDLSDIGSFNLSTSGTIKTTNTTNASSITTGALQSAGGLGVSNTAYIGGFLRIGGGIGTFSTIAAFTVNGDIFGFTSGVNDNGFLTALTDNATTVVFAGVNSTNGATKPLQFNKYGSGVSIGNPASLDLGAGTLSTAGRILSGGSLLSLSASGGIGYATGAGGTVTQATSKSTAVTLNTATGAITMNNAALGAGTIVSFVLNDSAVAATDLICAMHESGGTLGSYTINARATGAGTASIDVRNNTAGSLSEAIVIRFAVVKSVNS